MKISNKQENTNLQPANKKTVRPNKQAKPNKPQNNKQSRPTA